MMGFGDLHGSEIHHQGDLPARAGMGSSSSFAVGLLQALAAYRGQMIDKHELALRAVELEQVHLQESVGTQDQFAAAYGGLNTIEFRRGGEILVDPVTVDPERIRELERRLLLFYTGTSRLSSDVAADVVANLGQRREVLTRMRAMVDQAVMLLNSGDDLDEFGRMLHEAWSLKRKLSTRIASDTVEDVYRKAMRAGSLGGKLLGAGSSGFMVFYVPEKRQDAVRRTLSGYLQVPFGFESQGSRIIYYGSRAPELDAALRADTPTRSAPRRRSAGEVSRASL
jgi:D-glycero-alpha-D-manno-heptose-7-phosphate kinase